MTEVPARDLRNDTADVLRRVGRPVARLVPIPRSRRAPIPRDELIPRLHLCQGDPGLRDDLARLAGNTTDDLDLLW